MRKPNVAFALVASLVLLAGCRSSWDIRPSTPPSRSALALAGEYRNGLWYAGANLHLLSDGTFRKATYSDVIDSETGTSGTVFYGTYVLNNGLLVLTPAYSTPGEGAKPEYANRRTKWNDPPTALKPVVWGTRLYLLSPGEEEMRFCNAVNLGEEPRKTAQGPRGGPFLLRAGDESKPVSGRPKVSPQWDGYLLSKPIEAKVISVGKDATAVIDAGKVNNVRSGMVFARVKIFEQENYRSFTVIDVQDRQATIKNEITWWANINVGEKVSTRSNENYR